MFGAEWVHNGLVPVASKALNDYLVRRRSYFNKVLSGFEQFFNYKIWQNIYINSYMPTLPAHTQLSSSRSEIYLKLAPHLSIDLGTDFSPSKRCWYLCRPKHSKQESSKRFWKQKYLLKVSYTGKKTEYNKHLIFIMQST